MKPCLFIAGGGTGGHVFPSLCVALELKKQVDLEIVFLGTRRGMEGKIIADHGFPILYLTARGWDRRFDRTLFRMVGENILGMILGGWYFLRYRPIALLAMGSYLSLLGAMWAKLWGIPIYVHEQNIYPGLANRIISRWAKKVFISASDTLCYFPQRHNVEVVGNPLREEVRYWKGKKAIAQKELHLDSQRRTILVMGGSRGSEIINETFLQALSWLRKEDIQVIHLTGENHFSRVTEKAKNSPFPYRVYPFLSSPGIAYAASDLVVGRAGANTVFELFFFGLPAVLIPYGDAADSHQGYNALWLQQHQPVEIVEEGELCPALLAEKIQRMLAVHPYARHEEELYFQDAAQVIAQRIIEGSWQERRKVVNVIRKS